MSKNACALVLLGFSSAAVAIAPPVVQSVHPGPTGGAVVAAQDSAGAPVKMKAPQREDRPKPRDTCVRQVGLPTIRGLAGNDRISAGIAYRMFGDEDRDFLLGGRNDDEISGGDDADLLIGGGGADLFIYDTDFASLPDKEGRWSPATGDTIVDFRSEERDKIDLRQTKRFGANPPPHFWWSGSIAKPYSVWAVTGRGDTFLAADLDGDAGADLAIRFIGEIKLSEADFCGVRLQS